MNERLLLPHRAAGAFLSTNSYDKVADLMHACVQRDYFSVSPMTTSQ